MDKDVKELITLLKKTIPAMLNTGEYGGDCLLCNADSTRGQIIHYGYCDYPKIEALIQKIEENNG